MKYNLKYFYEIIDSKDMSIAEKFGRLVARIDKMRAELQAICERCRSEALAEGIEPECEGGKWACHMFSPKEILGDET